MVRRNFYIITIVVILFAFSTLAISAQEPAQPQQENKVVKFFKSVFKWPFMVTKEGAETVARTAEKGVTTGVKTTTSAVQTVTGKPEKIKDVVVEPIKGSYETGYTAVEGSLNTPVKGTKEAFE